MEHNRRIHAMEMVFAECDKHSLGNAPILDALVALWLEVESGSQGFPQRLATIERRAMRVTELVER